MLVIDNEPLVLHNLEGLLPKTQRDSGLHIAYGVLYVFTVNLGAVWFKHHSIKANRNITSWIQRLYTRVLEVI